MGDDVVGRPVMALVKFISDYQVQVLSGIAATLAERRLPLLVVAIDGFEAETTPEVVLDLIRRGVPRGVIALADVVAFRRPDLAQVLSETSLPIVSVGMRFGSTPLVHGDSVVGMRALMGHLFDECGVNRVVLVRGFPDYVDSVARERVYRKECAVRGIAVDEDLVVDGLFQTKPAYDRLRELLGRRQDFEAVVAFNDAMAFGALSALTDHGLRVPEDVLLSGFDNVRDSAASWPPLTTVDAHLEDQGARAADLLLRLLEGHPCPGDVQIPSQLAVRISTVPGESAAARAMTSARALQARVVVHELAMEVRTVMANCDTIAEVTAALGRYLAQVGVRRCFLGLDRPSGSSGGDRADAPGHPTRLAFSYRDGQVEEPTGEDFARHDLLPPSLRHELDQGGLLLQPLSIDGRERGYLLYDANTGCPVLIEALRIELPQAVEMVFSSQELTHRTAMLERLVTRRTRELERVRADLQRSVMRDGLTGIANRRAFENVLAQACHSDGQGSIALLMVDVDLFKAYNDHYGHLAGDDALKTVAECLVRSVRGSQDLACRYGGEEFAVVLPDCDLDGALGVARRFSDLLAHAAIVHAASSVASVVTASIGVASTAITPDVDLADLVAAADRALYQAKSKGRNQIAHADEGPRAVPRQRRAGSQTPQGAVAAGGDPADTSYP